MQLSQIERDIKSREDALRRCTYNLEALRKSPKASLLQEAISLMGQEAFFLQDQLDHYYSVRAFLREEQGSCDEMLPKA